MSMWCFKEGVFLFLPASELLILDRRARRRARQHNCGERHSVCLSCALLGGMISSELAERLQDPGFTLPAPLHRRKAKRWKPPASSRVDTTPPALI